MFKVTEEKNLAAIVEAAVEKHGTHADAFIPILLEINHNYGYIPAEAIRLARAKLHQPQDHSLVSEGQLYGLAIVLPYAFDGKKRPARSPILRQRSLSCAGRA